MSLHGDASSPPVPGAPPVVREHRRRHPIAWLLLLPLLGTLIPEIYNRTSPSIGGMPFFYWYELAWIPVSVACTLAVYLATRER